ncbi:hypothetical protein CsatB_004125 [Cannabis sativa]
MNFNNGGIGSQTNREYHGSNRGRRGNYRGGHGGNNSNRTICQLCGRSGHTVIKCFHRFDINFTGSQPTSTPSPNNDDSLQANITHTDSTSNQSQAWFLDTRATHHMANDTHNFNNATDYKGKAKVIIGQENEASTSSADLCEGLYKLQVHPTKTPTQPASSLNPQPSANNHTTTSNHVHDKSTISTT